MRYNGFFIFIFLVLLGCTPESFKMGNYLAQDALGQVDSRLLEVISLTGSIETDNEAIKKDIVHKCNEARGMTLNSKRILELYEKKDGEPQTKLSYSDSNAQTVLFKMNEDLESYANYQNLALTALSLADGVSGKFFGLSLSDIMYLVSGVCGAGGVGGLFMRERGRRRKAETGLESIIEANEDIKESLSLSEEQENKMNEVLKNRFSLSDSYNKNIYYETKKKRKK